MIKMLQKGNPTLALETQEVLVMQVVLKEDNLEEGVKAKVKMAAKVVPQDQEKVTHHPQDQKKEIHHHMVMLAPLLEDLDQVQVEGEDNHHLDKEEIKVVDHLIIHHIKRMHQREEEVVVEEIDQMVLREDPTLLGAGKHLDLDLGMVHHLALEEVEEEDLIQIPPREGRPPLLEVQIHLKQGKGMVIQAALGEVEEEIMQMDLKDNHHHHLETETTPD